MLTSKFDKQNTIKEKSRKWIIQNLDFFDIRLNSHLDSRTRLKSFVELVFILNPIIRKQGLNNKSLFPIINFVDEVIETFDFEAAAIKDISGLPGLLIIQDYLSISDKGIKFNLEKFTYERFLNTMEKNPFRMMDLKYELERVNQKEFFEPMQTLYLQTTPGKNRGIVFSLTEMEMYSITHVIFYITDMGNRNVFEIINKEQYKNLFALIEKSLIMSIKKEKYDIMSELLLCIYFLEKCGTREKNQFLFDYVWKLIYKKQEKDGSFFGINKNRLNRNSRSSLLKNTYHTTLVIFGASFLIQE